MPHEIIRFFRLFGEELELAFQPAIDERRRKILWYPIIATLVAITFKWYPLAGVAGLYCAYHITILAAVTAPVGIPLLWFVSVSLDEAGRRWVRFASGVLLGEIMFAVAATWLPLGNSWQGTFLAILASLTFVVAGIHWGTESRLGRWAIKGFTAMALLSAFALILIPASAEATGERLKEWDVKEVAVGIKENGFWATIGSWLPSFPTSSSANQPATGAKPSAGAAATPPQSFDAEFDLACGEGSTDILAHAYENGARRVKVAFEGTGCWTPVILRPETARGNLSENFRHAANQTIEVVEYFKDGTTKKIHDLPTSTNKVRWDTTGRKFLVPEGTNGPVYAIFNL